MLFRSVLFWVGTWFLACSIAPLQQGPETGLGTDSIQSVEDQNLKECIEAHLEDFTGLLSEYEGPVDCPKLQIVSLVGLEELPALRWLNLRRNNLQDRDLYPLFALKNLEKLNVEGNHLTEESLALLGSLEKLQSLNISANSLNGLSGLLGFLELRELDLSFMVLRFDWHLSYLADLPKLERLTLADCQLNDAMLAHFEGLETVKSLDLRHNQISELTFLRFLPALEKLWLKDNPLAHFPSSPEQLSSLPFVDLRDE